MNNSTSSINFETIFLKTVSALLFMLAFYSISAAQTTYTFTGEMDDRYENAANWTPAYPGTTVEANSIVLIEGVAVATEALTVNGTLHIVAGGSLEVEFEDLLISKTGKLMNDGEFYAATVHNAGMLNNNFAATIDIEGFVSVAGAMTNNLMAAEMIIRGNLSNGGVFNNYSTCYVEGDFRNAFSFYQQHKATMTVGGQQIELLLPASDSQMSYNAR